MSSNATLPSTRRGYRLFIALGLMLVVLTVGLGILSRLYEYGGDPAGRPTLLLVPLLMIAGGLFLRVISLIDKLSFARRDLLFILALGATMRIVLLPSTPILEDDYYRYLWDGGVVAAGHNPYAYSPGEVGIYGDPDEVPQELRDLAVDSGNILERVNHPSLSTVYPPVAQAAFAVAHVLRPWNVVAWRVVLLVFDCVSVGILILILKECGKPLAYCAVYWWNPLAVKVTINSAHMDPLLIPFLLLGIYWVLRNQSVRAATALALATAVKIWPVMVAPLFMRALKVNPKRLLFASLCGGLLSLVLLLPILSGFGRSEESGFVAYGREWEMNDALFMVVQKGCDIALRPFETDDDELPGRAARVVVGVMLLAWVAWLTRKPINSHDELFDRLVLAVGALFMLSPTQFPWYYLWLLPLLALSPRPSFLVLTMMLPMYYLKFYYVAHDDVDFFHNRLVWIEYAPTFVLLGVEAFRSRAQHEHA